MEIRIANPPVSIMKAVREDANKNERSIAKQVLFILKNHYGIQDEAREKKPRAKKVKSAWPV